MGEIETINIPTFCDPRDSSFEHPSLDVFPTRITKTSHKPSDYVNLKSNGCTATLELFEPLFHTVSNTSGIVELAAELSAVLDAIDVPGIEDKFTSIVAEYANSLLSTPVDHVSIGIGVTAYFLKKLFETKRLTLGVIRQIPSEETAEIFNFVENPEDHPVIEYAE